MNVSRPCPARVYVFFNNHGTFNRLFRLALSRRPSRTNMKRSDFLQSTTAAGRGDADRNPAGKLRRIVRIRLAATLGSIVLAFALGFTANAQAPAQGDDSSQAIAPALKKALEQDGCMQNGKFNAADLITTFDTGIVSSCLGNVPLSSSGSALDPAVITVLAATAYVWGLGPEYIYRFSKYNTIIGAPFNTLKYGAVPAAWNNEATNAGDASVLYISGFLNFNQSPEQVLTVPPSSNQYYVVAYLDAYANTVGSIGTRTTPSDTTKSYLLVGPNSRYAKKKTATIGGYEYPVMASDTNLSWFVIRVLANTLIDASDPTSVPNVASGVEQKFALNSLQEFEANGHEPVYPASFVLPPPTQEQKDEAVPYQNAPTKAVDFFNQLGDDVATSPIPNRFTGLSGTPLVDLPAWVVPQPEAKTTIYRVPSSGQKRIFDLFKPLGLTEKGFQIPADWGTAQKDALQAGYVLGQDILSAFIKLAAPDASTNYWGILNDPVGTYPSNAVGYLCRSLVVVEGGIANIALDAVYPTLTGNPRTLDGNRTYQLTFQPPTPYVPPNPVDGIYPPMVSDSNGNPKGFWSIHVYATDPAQAAAPFIAQTSVLNTSYSTADTTVLSVDARTNFMTVNAPNWGTLVASTPILFGGDAAAYGLKPNTVYYLATIPKANADNTTYTFQISTQWRQTLSSGKGLPVPIQGPNGQHGPIVDLRSPAGGGALKYGMVKPVTQLGSSQLAANQLVRNADGSLTLWFGPTLPSGAPASNWIPTPSTAYYRTIYNTAVRTKFQLTLRMYYPTPGNEPPSILPCTAQACGSAMPESYIPPALKLVR